MLIRAAPKKRYHYPRKRPNYSRLAHYFRKLITFTTENKTYAENEEVRGCSNDALRAEYPPAVPEIFTRQAISGQAYGTEEVYSGT